jgi:hypothetical protein
MLAHLTLESCLRAISFTCPRESRSVTAGAARDAPPSLCSTGARGTAARRSFGRGPRRLLRRS